MDLDTDEMRSAAYGLRNIGDQIQAEASDEIDDLNNAGDGNDGFKAISKLKSAVDAWVPAAERVATSMRDTAESIETAANSFDQTDEDNSSQICEAGNYPDYPGQDGSLGDPVPSYSPLRE